MKCLKITVKGTVQGVGFRYFCYRKADEFCINGYARNLYNGDVEIMAEGEEGMLNDFIKAVKTGPPFSSVNSLQIEDTDSKNRFTSFRIY